MRKLDRVDYWLHRLYRKFARQGESMNRFDARISRDPESVFWMLMWLKREDVRKCLEWRCKGWK